MSVYRSEALQPGQPLIDLRNVSQRYELQRARNRSLQEAFIGLFRKRSAERSAFWPLRNVTFRVDAGESIGIIGPNGSGKSTLLKLLSGILTPTSGDLIINGRISSLLELGAGFHPELTGRENIYLNGSIYGVTRRAMDAKLADIIDYAELGDFIDTPVKHYSSGMYVRLGFAVAIHTAPDLLFVDEVLAVGDAVFQRKCLASIQEFRDAGQTLILVSHDLATIQNICNRVLWLEQGELRADGKPTDVIMAYLHHVAAKEAAKAEQKRQAARQHADEATVAEAAPDPADAAAAAAAARRWGNGQVIITQVELCDEYGRPQSHFANGDQLLIRLYYIAETTVRRPVFGLAFYHQNGVHISGPNSKFDSLSIPIVHGAGVIEYCVPALPLLEGSYTLSVAVVNDANTETFDYHDRLYNLEVYRGRTQERYGLVTFNGKWRLPATANAAVIPLRTHEPA